ncbi:RHS repeat-associated core domain-containing protein [Galbitalea soli]|uniref:Transglycosylase SLT domain-containing protein n=1 Tax=Galbitalea soli TaxID=1268042 RepID=A0A7C9PMC9_9MICO|nr:RHS repeat-associated core domain-containing protein [Galbitalea soli]NEM90890.1 transglycosylase SLT domain-containing protein [Galbitalea soli]NYJ31611.1 RHS repeat-associated protein [Galbitalea soli]
MDHPFVARRKLLHLDSPVIGVRRGLSIILALALFSATLSATPASAAGGTRTAPIRTVAARSTNASSSVHSGEPDIAVDGVGDAAGYHVRIATEGSGFAWSDLAVIKPANLDEQNWYGYQCLSPDGKYVAVAILPGSGENVAEQRFAGAYAYSINVAKRRVTALAAGVGSFYFSPSCGLDGSADFTASLGARQQVTEVLRFDLSSGNKVSDSIVSGQITSAAQVGNRTVGVEGNSLVALAAGGTNASPAKVRVVLAHTSGLAYGLRSSSDGGVDYLTKSGQSTSSLWHLGGGKNALIATGQASRMQLFAGGAGRNFVVGYDDVLANPHVRPLVVDQLPLGPSVLSLQGTTAFGPSVRSKIQSAKHDVVLEPSTTDSDVGLTESTQTHRMTKSNFTTSPEFADHTDVALAGIGPQPGVENSNIAPNERAKSTTRTGPATAAATLQLASTFHATPALSSGATTPTCAIPRLNPTLQALQPGNAQVSWAIEMAEQGLLIGASSTRPANFDNMGLVSYQPSGDFPPISLHHPSSDTWASVPRSVMEAIVSQESNYNQASWHALPGIAGDPLIADYYGSGGTITSINYPSADCGYGLSQLTTGMHATDTSLSYHGQMKVAVDYQENVAAGLQILEKTWNQLYDAGVTANGGDPRYLENWYFAAWAYNTGVQPTAAYGNTTGCTPSPTCTGPDGTWGLGWSNNPANPSYNPARLNYLEYSYGDAAHPSSWPYQERILGWMGSPLVRYSYTAFTPPDYHGGSSWLQVPPFGTFCTSSNVCSNTGTYANNCGLVDYECWWHLPVTWVASCATTCATSSYTAVAGSTEPTYTPPASRPVTATCTIDTSVIPSGSIIVDDLSAPVDNLQGCSGSAWTSGGSFTLTPGTNTSGDPIGNIDIHQLGAGLGGHAYFTHTEPAASSSLINKGTWTPSLPSTQYYKVKIHLPATGAVASDVVYSVYPGSGGAVSNVRVNQDWGSEQWVTIGTFAMGPGGSVSLTNASNMTPGVFDVAFDAVAFVPMGGTPGVPIGGPKAVVDAPLGSNPAWVNCGCGARTAGDPVDLSTGYFAQSTTDLSTPGRGLPFAVTRSYGSAVADPAGPSGSNSVSGAFGPGWSYSYGMSTTTNASTGSVTVLQEDGSRVSFTLSGTTYTPQLPRFAVALTKSGTTYIYTRRGGSVFTFDTASGHLLAEYDQPGYFASPKYGQTLAYDGSGNLHTVTDPGGRIYTFTWTSGRVTKVTTSGGQEVDYSFNALGQLTNVYGVGTTRVAGVNSDDDHAQYSYTNVGLMTSFRTPANYGKTGTPTPVTTMVYDASERVTSQTDPMGSRMTILYGPDSATGIAAGQVLVTDAAGHKDLQTYANGLMTSETKGYGTTGAATWSYTYDPLTLGVASQTNPDGSIRTFSYDDNGDRISSSDELGRTTQSLYDGSGHLLQETTPDLLQRTLTYNTAGAETSEAIALPGQTAESSTSNPSPTTMRKASITHTDAAHPADPTTTVDFNGNVTSYSFDASGDLTSQTDSASHVTKYGYNTSRGLRIAIVSPRGVAAGTTTACVPPATGCTTFAYDMLGRLTQSIDPLGHRSSNTYDADGNVLTSTDANSHTTTNVYDNDDRLVSSSKPTGVTTNIYNGDGTLASTTDYGAHATSYAYDALGRLVSSTDPDGKITQYGYDTVGNRTTVTDPNGTIAHATFDAARQESAITYSGTLVAPSVSFTYDNGGRRTSMTDASGTSSYTYDSFGELISFTNGNGSTVGYGYDADGNQTSITYPGTGNTVIRTFNNLNQLSAVKDPAARITSFGYDADGRQVTTTYPNGDSVATAYNDASQETSTALANGSTALDAFAYGRDNVGNETSVTPSNGALGGSMSFTYDSNNQLAASVVSGATITNTFDSAGNPTKVGAVTQVFDTADRLCWTSTGTPANPTCSSPTPGANLYGSNYDGERTSMTPSAGVATNYTWNGAGELAGISGATTANYVYNGDGLRSAKTAGGTTTHFTWSEGAVVPELLTDGTSNYLYGPSGAPIEQTSVSGASSPSWIFADAHGSTAALLDLAGAVVGRYAYSAWGAVASHSGARSTSLQFNGQYVDDETGFIYLRARYYDPATALFLSVDAMVGETLSAFTYANNNPLTNVDPLGLWSTEDTWKVVGLVGLGLAMIALGATGIGLILDAGAVGAEAALGADLAASLAVEGADAAAGATEAADAAAAASRAANAAAAAEKVKAIADAGSKGIDVAQCAIARDRGACAGALLDVGGAESERIGEVIGGTAGRRVTIGTRAVSTVGGIGMGIAAVPGEVGGIYCDTR